MMEIVCVRSWCKLLAAILLLLFTIGDGLRPATESPVRSGSRGSLREVEKHTIPKNGDNKDLRVHMISATGSSLPDCSHACGPCFPCKRVMVSFKCSVAESCPIVYRCMCRGKYYHVPSN